MYIIKHLHVSALPVYSLETGLQLSNDIVTIPFGKFFENLENSLKNLERKNACGG